MTQILIHPEAMGLDATGARFKLKSSSVKRAEITFYGPDNTIVKLPAQSDMLAELNRQVWPDGQGKPSEVDDVMALWEKDYALNVLRDKQGFDVRVRTEKVLKNGQLPKPASQWDYVEVSVEATVSDEAWAVIQEEAINSFRDTRQNERTSYVNGEIVPFTGVHGKRAIFVSTTHDNTGKRHIHILANRVAFDMENKEVSASVDLSKSGNLKKALDDLQHRLVERGVVATMGIAGAIGNDQTRNQQERDAQVSVNEELTEAGGRSLNDTTATFSVEVPLGNGQTTFVAAPLTTDEAAMQRHLATLKESTLRTEREIERMKAEASANNRAVVMVEQALQVLANERVLRADLVTTKEQLEQANAKGVTLEEANTDLSEKLDAAETARQIQHEALVGIGTELSEKAGVLGIDDEQAQDLATGNVVAIGTMVESLGKQVGTWNEALDQLPEEMADALRDDPFQGLNDLVDELLDKRAETTKLTAQNEALQGELTASNTLNAELQSQVTTMTSDLADLQARMAKREEEFEAQMAEQVKKVTEAQANVARAEGTVLAKQEQLVAEQAKVEKLTRTQDALMSVLTSENAGQAWEHHKDMFKDDVFAERAMKAYLLTSANLDASKQKVEALEKDVAEYAEVKKNLADVQAVVEENLVLVNDAGVADLRTLVQQHKTLTTGNAKLNQQIDELAQAAEAAQKATAQAQAELAKVQEQLAQKSDQPQVDYQRKAVLDLFEKDPAFAALVVEAAGSDSVRAALLAIANDADNGMTPEGGQAPGQAPTDYTKGLEDEKKGPEQGGPDQNI